MKYFLSFLIAVAFVSANAQNNVINIIPQPVEIIQNSGFFNLSKSSSVRYNKPGISVIAQMLVQKLNTSNRIWT